jgi:hypothetical protein
MRLSDGQLDGVRGGSDQGLDAFLEILDPLQEPALIEKAVVDRHVETAIGAAIKEPIDSVTFHKIDIAYPEIRMRVHKQF